MVVFSVLLVLVEDENKIFQKIVENRRKQTSILLTTIINDKANAEAIPVLRTHRLS